MPPSDDHDDPREAAHHAGLAADLRTLLRQAPSRRTFLGLFAGASAITVLGCAADDGATGVDARPGADADPSSCSEIPTETAGPYPGDGTNGANALALAGIVRSDIRSSIAGATGVADGVPLTITLTIVDTANACAPLAGRAVYLWHCDRGGDYSMYTGTAVAENYLRGVQETDDAGQVTFTTIVPGCYSGRWPHVHFEIYASLAAATNGANTQTTSQLALPEATCDAAYATTGYESSIQNLSQITLATDNIFSDGASLQLASVTGSALSGFAATLTVAL